MDFQLKELVELLARFLADHPERIRVREIKTARTSILQLRAAQGDLHQLIGKNSQNAEAIVVILNAAATRVQRRCFLEVVGKPDLIYNIGW